MMGLGTWFRKMRGNRPAYFDHDFSSLRGRRKGRIFTEILDAGILRHRWHNAGKIAPDIMRSNHPDSTRLDAHAKDGIATILSLRNDLNKSPHKFEVETCQNLGISLINLPISARKAPSRNQLIVLISLMEELPKPLLIHCKSGADRTGLAGAIYHLVYLGADLATARQQLSSKFLHYRWSETGILDEVLLMYGEAFSASGIGFRDWAKTDYDQAETTRRFAHWRASNGVFSRMRECRVSPSI